MHERVGIERRQLYLPVRRHMARMARAAETRENGRRRREVVFRFMITLFGPALYRVLLTRDTVIFVLRPLTSTFMQVYLCGVGKRRLNAQNHPRYWLRSPRGRARSGDADHRG